MRIYRVTVLLIPAFNQRLKYKLTIHHPPLRIICVFRNCKKEMTGPPTRKNEIGKRSWIGYIIRDPLVNKEDVIDILEMSF
jgi:hypothetical protein